jgi:predicted nucleotidyltransferase
MQIDEQISQALGIPVTIATRDARHPLMKDNTEREVVLDRLAPSCSGSAHA